MAAFRQMALFLVPTSFVMSVWDFQQHSTVRDQYYDAYNDYAIKNYNWGTEEPNTSPVYVNPAERSTRWTWAYEGHAPPHNIYDPSQKEDPNEDSNWAITWAVGIKGFDALARRYGEADCMGTLIHPQIVMTLCACVNSWYSSYYGLEPYDATPERFKVSPTSDQQFDIRAPNLVATRSTWRGYVNLTGEQDIYPISKTVLQSEQCYNAIVGDDQRFIVNQYRLPVFLRLKGRVRHPFNSSLPSYYNFSGDPLGGPTFEEIGEKMVFRSRREGWKLRVIAYFQELWSTNAAAPLERETLKVKHTNESIDFTKHLMVTEVDESDNKASEEHYLFDCAFSNYNQYYTGTHAVSNSSWPETLRAIFRNSIKKPEVGCLTYFKGLLCNAPPGSPVIMYNKFFGMTMNRFTQCEVGKATTLWLVMAAETQHMDYQKDAADLVAYVDTLRTEEGEALATDQPFFEEQVSPVVEVIGNIDQELVSPAVKFLVREQIATTPPTPPPREITPESLSPMDCVVTRTILLISIIISFIC